MTEEVQTALPAEVPATEQAANVEKPSTEATPEQTQEGASAPENTEATKKEPWFQKRIDVLTREKYEKARIAETATQEAQALREQLAQLQRGEEVTQQPAGNVQTLVQQEAAKLVAEQRFNDACNKVAATGRTEFQDFNQSVENLHLVGVGREFFELVATSDAGAKLIDHLGHDMDEAARVAALPPLLMARELTKLEIKLSQVKPKPVSNAPAPLSLVTGGGGGSKSPADMSDAEYAKWRKSART